MSHELITTDAELEAYCERLAGAPTICFDTEFVSEHTYRPELCLIQVAVGDELALIDPQGMRDVVPFWKAVAAPGHETIVHAGRQEVMYCLDATDQPPHDLFDVQLGAGMVGLEYPAGYGALLARLLGERPSKGETRTDWRRRPLSHQQIEYALDDVRYLSRLRKAIGEKLARLGREAWLDDEIDAWLADVNASRGGERWRRVTGSSGLSARSLAIVREVWSWREREAERRNVPAKHILRDDLIVELAKRRVSDPKQIGAVRGMERGDYRRMIPELSKMAAKALAMPDNELPEIIRSDTTPQLTMLAQFLSSALSSICRQAQVAASLVGTASDVRDLIAYHAARAKGTTEPAPALACGWRAEVVGKVLDDLLDGHTAIRIVDPDSDQPLVFERVEDRSPARPAR
ncbi:MAG TPA: HRDC domain-containing protein [Pirellulales bacterium]|jgi:ribonuclease D|nr:HRDC domain-containing protein [Pirellulales bacterium]